MRTLSGKSGSAFSNRVSRKSSLPLTSFSKVNVKQEFEVYCQKKNVTMEFVVESSKNVFILVRIQDKFIDLLSNFLL